MRSNQSNWRHHVVLQPLLCCAAAISLILTTGCTQPQTPPEPKQPLAFFKSSGRRTALVGTVTDFPPYRVAVGDTIRISGLHHIRPPSLDLPQNGDTLQLIFADEPRYAQSLIIDTDGLIRPLLVEPLQAAGIAPTRLKESLQNAYGRYLRHPDLVVEWHRPHAESPEIDTSEPQRIYRVGPDGTLHLPRIGVIRAFDRTLEELHDEIKSRAAGVELDAADLHLDLDQPAPRRVFLIGEVAEPGMLGPKQPVTLLQAIAAAGGLTDQADPTQVILIRRYGLPAAERTEVDLTTLLHMDPANAGHVLPPGSDPWLADGDVVHVPQRANNNSPFSGTSQ